MDGVEATRIIKENFPHIKIIILTTFNEDEFIFQGPIMSRWLHSERR